MIPMVRTKDGISFILSGRPFNVAESDGHFKDVYDAIKSNKPEAFIADILERVKNRLGSLRDISPSLSFDGAAIWFNGSVLHNYAADRIIELISRNEPVDPMVRFLEKLLKNPSGTVVNNLYEFLEYGRIPLTQDGDFLVYKAVQGDFKDIHSGTMDNSVGQIVKMPRWQVDEDRNNTCSRGLHVCSYEYLPHFSHANGHVVICKVNPANVVAIPSDYNNTKMRVSEYEVIGVVDDYYTREENVLSSQPFFQVGGVDPDSYGFDEDEEDEDEEIYEVWVREVGNNQKLFHDSFSDYAVAHDRAKTVYQQEAGIIAAAVIEVGKDRPLYTWGLWTV